MQGAMSTPRAMSRLLPLVREYGVLERKRLGDGLTRLEYQRWLDLHQQLDRHFPKSAEQEALASGQAERRAHPRIPTRLLVHYRSPGELRQAIIRNVSRGGLFIETAFAPPVGTRLQVRLRVDDGGEEVEVPCEVVSVNISADLGARRPGMGVKFDHLSPSQQAAVDRLFALALEEKT